MDNTSELTTAQRRLVSWLATPEIEREPRTVDALATEIGVRTTTIERWRTHKLDALATQKARMRLLEHLPDVYQALARKAEGGSHEHIGLFLRITAGELGAEFKEVVQKGCMGGDNYTSG